jgi:hypothetical protein
MNQSQKDLVPNLKQIIEKRIIKEEPSVGIYGWICITKTIPLEKGQSYYKIGNTGRLEAYLSKQKGQPIFLNDTPPLVLKVWGGASFFIKVIRRIFKDKRVISFSGGASFFVLNDEDISWLSKIKIAKTANIESEVYKIFDETNPSFVTILRREGLF